ncbi:MAG TPA: multiheme c-type cytochrome [Polyangiaceae bacterium]
MSGEERPEPSGAEGAQLGLWLLCVALGLAVCLTACTRDSAVSSAAASAAACCAMPGPAPRGRDVQKASALNATCAGCHREIAAEWSSSFHARAERNAAYQRAFALEPLPFCQGCHAPEADAFRPVTDVAADLGVGCVTCHVVNEHVLAAPSPSGSLTDAVPHAVTRAPDFAGVAACANCHEFAFPDAELGARPELMQATASEHERSNARGVACATCHMPNVGAGSDRHHSHAFPGGHDEGFVKGAISVRAERCTSESVCLVLVATRVGHAFPTGDLFRRLEVSVEAIGGDDQVVASARRYLSRHWSDQHALSTVVRRVSKDDRATDVPLRLELTLGGAVASLPVAWRVAYQRVEHPRSEAEADSALDGEIELASGTLLPLSKGEGRHVEP